MAGFIYKLQGIVTSRSVNNLDAYIAKSLLINIHNIKPNTTISELAEMCYTSDSSLSRLAVKLGYKNFHGLKQDILNTSDELEELLIDNSFLNTMDYSSYTNSILWALRGMNHEKLVRDIDILCDLILQTTNIYFFATHIPADLSKMMQRIIIATGKYVTFFTDKEMQIALVDTVTCHDLCIFISLEGTLISEKNITIPVVSSQAKTVLITQNKNMKFASYFDTVISLGEHNEDFTGKFKLLYFMDCFMNRFFHHSKLFSPSENL